MTSQIKVYISNLNYHTTEDELREYLADTKATNVFIPNYFVGFGSSRFKPLGIAYADLPTSEDAEGFIKVFEGKLFKDRKLKIRLHVPYTPSQKLSRLSSINSIKRSAKNETKEVKEEDKENVDVEAVPSLVEKKYSDNGIFVKGLKAKTSEDDLKALFKDFNPTEVRIFKPRGWMRGLKHRSHNAIVTFDLPEEKTLDEVIDAYSGEKCCGNTIAITRAYLNGDRGIDLKEVENGSEALVVDEVPASEPVAEEKTPEAGPPDVAPAPADEVTILPDDAQVSKGDSTEHTMQSFDQDNVSGKAVHEANVVSDEQPPVVAVVAEVKAE